MESNQYATNNETDVWYRLQVESLLSNGFMWAGDYDTREEAQSAFMDAYEGDGRKFMITKMRGQDGN